VNRQEFTVGVKSVMSRAEVAKLVGVDHPRKVTRETDLEATGSVTVTKGDRFTVLE
jgi:hypothetical protein